MMMDIIMWLQQETSHYRPHCQVDTTEWKNPPAPDRNVTHVEDKNLGTISSEITPETYHSETFNDVPVKRDVIDKLVTVVMHLDHMRARNKYVKTIQKWTKSLALVGRLIFFEQKMKPIIIILLQGTVDAVKVGCSNSLAK